MKKLYDLDAIYISHRVQQSWLSYCPVAVQEILGELKEGETFDSHDIPDEQFRELKPSF